MHVFSGFLALHTITCPYRILVAGILEGFPMEYPDLEAARIPVVDRSQEGVGHQEEESLVAEVD